MTERFYHAVADEWTEGSDLYSLGELHDWDSAAMADGWKWDSEIIDADLVALAETLDDATAIANMFGLGRVLVIEISRDELVTDSQGYPAKHGRIDASDIVDIVRVSK